MLGPKTKGTRTNIENVDEDAKYSWVKSPRWKGNAVEVGPLARYIVAYAQGNKEVKEPVDQVLKTLDVPVTALFSTLGRTAARGLECSVGRAQDEVLLRQADGQHQGGRLRDRQRREVGAVDLAATPSKGVGFLRGAARRARALDEDQGHEDRQLPVRGADDLERAVRATPRTRSAPTRPRC